MAIPMIRRGVNAKVIRASFQQLKTAMKSPATDIVNVKEKTTMMPVIML
jgi:hypothetical protein